MTPVAPAAAYRVVIGGEILDIPGEWVIPWVHGVADAHGGRAALAAVDSNAAQDTQRIHFLQIAHAHNWLEYRYLIRPEPR